MSYTLTDQQNLKWPFETWEELGNLLHDKTSLSIDQMITLGQTFLHLKNFEGEDISWEEVECISN